ncbi:MAG: FAD-dependent oxidoreductase [Polyangiaceae bacterium]
MLRKTIAVIGAGPAGLTAALELTKRGFSVRVFEAGPHVGGLARTIELWDQKVDIGPHRFFSRDARVNRVWLDVVGRDYAMVDRMTRIYYRKKFFHYPLRAGDALAKLGAAEAARCIASYGAEALRQRLNGPRARAPASEDEAFEDWVVRRFGRRLFEIFFKTYSEKLWGISCKELDADFAAQRIKKLSLVEAAKNALNLGAQKHATLVDRFAYPRHGTGSVYERMAARVVAAGGTVSLNRPVKRVVREGARVTGLELVDGTYEAFDHVISTMPLTLLVRGLGDADEGVRSAVDSLTFRNTLVVFLKVEAKDVFPDQWLYIHSADLLMGRVTNFRNWVPDICGRERASILALEFWCNDEDRIWSEDDAALVDRARREMRATGLLGDASVSAGHVVRVRRCYPVYRRGYKAHLARIVSFLRSIQNLTPIGRYGAFKYNNQDHSILMGLLAAENIAGEAHHDLWAINTDYDSYQEEAVITETGLEAAAT